MKNLKIKFGLFSLLAVLAVSVFLTSCEQESILPDTLTDSMEQIELETTPQAENTLNVLLPENIVSQGEEAAKAHISSMTIDELTLAAKDFATIQYLQDKNKLDKFQAYIIDNGNLQGANLSEHLSDSELAELNSELATYTSSEVSSRCDEYVCYWLYYIVGTTLYFVKHCYWI